MKKFSIWRARNPLSIAFAIIGGVVSALLIFGLALWLAYQFR